MVSEVLGARAGLQRVLVDLGSTPERAFVRESLRAHVSDNFPELQAP